MSMLRYFFEVGTDKTLFDGLYISQNEKICEEYMGKYVLTYTTILPSNVQSVIGNVNVSNSYEFNNGKGQNTTGSKEIGVEPLPAVTKECTYYTNNNNGANTADWKATIIITSSGTHVFHDELKDDMTLVADSVKITDETGKEVSKEVVVDNGQKSFHITFADETVENGKQKKYIIKLLLKTWLGILCFSLLCTFCAVWLLFQNTKQSSYDNINIAYEGILLTWAIIGVIMFSAGTITLFMNYFPVIRYNNIYRFLSFFLVPMLLILWCGTEILCLWTVAIPFLVCLSGAYLLFRNKIKNTANNAG